ncbi:glycosyl transferase [Salinisphaera sp. PC39]|uniref:glycosyltransferase family 4 protein n=1 Tax=Salinisphaera sp. PC39 TaxID=1304156 RepID=UPI003341BF9D
MDSSVRRIALIGNQAFAAINFRGPLIRDLVAAGHRVYAFAPDFDEATRAGVRELGAEPVAYPLQRVGLNPVADLRSMFALWRLLRRLRIDVALCYFIKPVIYGTLAAWLARVPRRVALIEGAGYVFASEADGSLKRRLLRMAVTGLYRFALRRAQHVLVLNSDDRELFVSRRMVAPERIDMLPGIGIDLDRYAATEPVVEPMTFVLAARLIAEKGVRVYARAARVIKEQYPEVRFLLLGQPDDNPDSLDRSEVEGWVADGILEWPGQVADVRPYLAGSSVFVLPTYYREGLPRSILEAMAMARPVITTDNPGCRDAIVDGECGYLVPVRDADSLAEAMRRFIERPALVGEFGRAGRQRAETLYDVRSVNRQLISTMLAVTA